MDIEKVIEEGKAFLDKGEYDNATEKFAEAMKLDAKSAFRMIPENLRTLEWCLMATKADAMNVVYIPANLQKTFLTTLKDDFNIAIKVKDDLCYKKGYDEGTKAIFALWESGISLAEAKEKLESGEV